MLWRPDVTPTLGQSRLMVKILIDRAGNILNRVGWSTGSSDTSGTRSKPTWRSGVPRIRQAYLLTMLNDSSVISFFPPAEAVLIAISKGCGSTPNETTLARLSSIGLRYIA